MAFRARKVFGTFEKQAPDFPFTAKVALITARIINTEIQEEEVVHWTGI